MYVCVCTHDLCVSTFGAYVSVCLSVCMCVCVSESE